MKYLKHDEMGYFNHGWLKTYHHFTFGEYYNKKRMNYGPLRVVNDDIVDPHSGFPEHPHRDMEIVSYVVSGGLSHGDSMGHKETVYRGEVQYMSAGTGVYHSESNERDEPVRLLQIWVYPDKKGYEPNYGDFRFKWEDRINKWLHLVGEHAPIKIHQDVNFLVTFLEAGESLDYEIKVNRQAYVVEIENDVIVNNMLLKERDALEVSEGQLKFNSVKGSHIMIIDMSKTYKKS